MQLAAYRRYAHYDYSRGAALFITLATEPRRCLFGDVVAGEMRLSPFGRAVAAELAATIAASPDVRLYGWAVLPDHLHFRLYLMPGLSNDEACRRLNRLVGRFKSRTTHVFWVDFGGHGLLWQKGYHDWLCLSREMIDSVERYIGYNALKWWLRHGGGRRLMALHEPLQSPRLGCSEYWRGVGAVDLLAADRPLVGLRVSRRCSPADIAALVDRLRAKAGEFVVASGFISPGERTVLSALLAAPEAKIVKISPFALPHDYAPPVALLPAIAEGRLAVIARGNSPEELSRSACLDLNERLVDMADHAAYALPGEIHWLK